MLHFCQKLFPVFTCCNQLCHLSFFQHLWMTLSMPYIIWMFVGFWPYTWTLLLFFSRMPICSSPTLVLTRASLSFPRGSQSGLFLPFCSVISWLVNLTVSVRAHSTRVVSMLAPFSTDVSLDICTAASWSSPLTFISHHALNLRIHRDPSFGQLVLQSIFHLNSPIFLLQVCLYGLYLVLCPVNLSSFSLSAPTIHLWIARFAPVCGLHRDYKEGK